MTLQARQQTYPKDGPRGRRDLAILLLPRVLLTTHKREPCFCTWQVQDIFETLPDTGNDDAYDTAVEKLKASFEPEKNLSFETQKFRHIEQGPTEPMSSFVSRLKKSAAKWEFGALQDRMIQDQIFEKLHDPDGTIVRRLYRIPDINIERILKLCRTDELANEQQTQKKPDQGETVNAVRPKHKHYSAGSTQHKQTPDRKQGPQPHKQYSSYSPKYTHQNKYTPPTQSQKYNYKCSRCGKMNHKSADCRVAKDKYCNKCGHLGHFAVVCRTRLPKNGQKKWNLTPIPIGFIN